MEFKDYLELNGHSSDIYAQVMNKVLNTTNLTSEAIMAYILKIKSNYSVEYANLHIKAIKAYLKFKEIDIELPKLYRRPNKLPKFISEKYFEETIIPMLDCIFSNHLRIKALLYFMFYTGLRQSEMVSLKRKDIDLTNCSAKIYEIKTKQERLTMFPKRVANILLEYFNKEPETENAFNLGKYTINEIFRTMKPYFEKEVNLYPHLFRHSFATMLLKKGIDVSIVSNLLGHKNLNTTMRYLGLNDKLIQEIYNEKVR